MKHRNILLCTTAALVLAPASALAVTLTVNSADDTSDGNCDGSHCSLREAITAAGTGDTIEFNFSAPGTQTITLTSTLPDLSADSVFVDGLGCTGCGLVGGNTNLPANGLNSAVGIHIDGNGVATQLTLSGDSIILEGVAVSGMTQNGIRITGSGVTVRDCRIGTNTFGTAPTTANSLTGIRVEGGSATIGPYNLISANGVHGIDAYGANADATTIIGNLIGTNISATAALANGHSGVRAVGFGNGLQTLAVGDGTAAGRNIISGNVLSGVVIVSDVSSVTIDTNTIGTNGAQSAAVPNGEDGIRIEGGSSGGFKPETITIDSNVIAGNGDHGVYITAAETTTLLANSIGTDETDAVALGNGLDGVRIQGDAYRDCKFHDIGDATTANANFIAWNGGDGIAIGVGPGAFNAKENLIGVNSIHDNTALGIDLEDRAGTAAANEPLSTSCSNDNDWGNRGVGHPVVTAAELQANGDVVVTGTSCSGAAIDVYEADGDASGYGEPVDYLDSTTASGTAWTATLSGTGFTGGESVTAIQTDADDETGEPGLNVTVFDCDVDGDGGNSTACAGGTDCDDGEPTVFSGAPELCDGLDNDCLGGVPTNEVDNDGDSFLACAECDDNDINANPGETETCDGVDEDCVHGIDNGFDTDGDGVTTCGPDGTPGNADDDCNDNDINISPDEPEVCDAIDQDCDLVLDNGFDVDGDGFTTCGADGTPGNADDDCDDALIGVNPNATETCDGVDEDCTLGIDNGFDTDGDGVTTCGPDGTPGNADDDCNDNDIDISPNEPEVCDAIDQDCDLVLDNGFDVDVDGYTTCGADGILGNADDDCDDGAIGVNPGEVEACDAVDEDCDGTIDNGFDTDGDGVTTCGPDGTPGNADDDCDDGNAAISPDALELCNGFDDDCDGQIDENADNDGDGVTNCDGDCDDDNASTFPGAPEICDGEDNDCDSSVPANEDDGDGDGFRVCENDCDDGEAAVNPDAEDTCGDGIDNDCDGVDPEVVDVDGDGFTPCDGDCDDDVSAVNPDAEEVCADGIDNDCDGVDLDDVDDDGDGVSECDGDCDDAESTVSPDLIEICDDDLDNDCDRETDESEDLDLDGFGACLDDCDDADATVNPGAEEICGDGIDQNCDDNDPSCFGVLLETPTDIGCSSTVSGTRESTGSGALLGGLAMLLGLGGLRRRRSIAANLRPFVPLALAAVLLGCGPTGGVEMRAWWGTDAPASGAEDILYRAGGAFRAGGMTQAFAVTDDEGDSRNFIEVIFAGAAEPADCFLYSDYLARLAGTQAWLDEVWAVAESRPAVADVAGLLCQEARGAAAEAFGDDGSFASVHALVEVTGGEPASDDLWLPAPAGGASAGSEALTPGTFVSRVFDRGGPGMDLGVEDTESSEAAHQACITRASSILTTDDPDAVANAVWSASSRASRHFDAALPTVGRQEGGELQVGALFPGGASPGSPPATGALTAFSEPPEAEGGGYARMLVSSGDVAADLELCTSLSGHTETIWPELFATDDEEEESR